MTRDDRGGDRRRIDVQALLRRQHGVLEEIFTRYCLSDEEALRVLDDALFALHAREGGIGDPDRWLLETVEDACRQRSEECEDEVEN